MHAAGNLVLSTLVRNPDSKRKTTIDKCINPRHKRILLLLPHKPAAVPWLTGSSYIKSSLRLAGASVACLAPLSARSCPHPFEAEPRQLTLR